MDDKQKEELKKNISILMKKSESQQVNTKGGRVDLRRLEYYIHQLIDEIYSE